MKITIKNLQKKIPINPKRITQAVLKVISCEGAKKSGEITVSFVNDRKIGELNLRFLGKKYPTDVLAFDISDTKREILGDIVVSADTAIFNARAYGTTPLYELYLYVIHGVLHLLGHRDKTPRQRKAMQDKAEKFLSTIRQCLSIKPKP